MFKRLCLVILGLSVLPSVLRAVQTPIYPVLSDVGIAGQEVFVWGPASGFSVLISSLTTTPAPPEGFYSWRTQFVGNGATWVMIYLNEDRSTRVVDLSAYSTGEIRFWANCNSLNFHAVIQHSDGFQDGYPGSELLSNTTNQWVPVTFSLSRITQPDPSHVPPWPGYPINDIVYPFAMIAQAPVTCYIDNIRYVNSSAPPAPVFQVNVRKIADGSPAGSNITWGAGVAPSSGWVMANEYLELQVDDSRNFRNWGVQIYTDNMNSAATPRFVAVSTSANPAGLVGVTYTGQAIPMAWSVTSGTSPAQMLKPTAAEPNDLLANPPNPRSFPWLYLKDMNTPDIPSNQTVHFQPGEIYATVKNHVGIHYGQNNALNQPNLGAADAPNYIFLEANFGKALAQQQYRTSRLTVEFFTL